jgi:D-alanyl-D-alanine carboxypeptidase
MPDSNCLDRLLDSIVRGRSIPYVTYRAETGRGDLIYEGARGEADQSGRTMRPDTPFFIASIDKLMTAAVILQLQEEGRLSVDDRIGRHLPDWAWQRIHRLDSSDHSASLTVRHLLSHTSGLPDWLEDRPRGGKSLVESALAEGDRTISDEEAIDHVRTLEPHFAPPIAVSSGRRARYSDTNFVLLRLIAEGHDAMPIGEIFERRIVRPLELRHTWTLNQTQPVEAIEPALLYAGKDPFNIPALLDAVRSVYSTNSDLIRFLRAMIEGSLFQDAATGRAMQTTWVKFGFAIDPAALRSPSWPIEYGLGMKRFRMPRLLTPLRPMPYVVGHTGSTGTWLFYCPKLDVYLSGCVGQVTAGAVPFRTLGRQLRCLTR